MWTLWYIGTSLVDIRWPMYPSFTTDTANVAPKFEILSIEEISEMQERRQRTWTHLGRLLSRGSHVF